MPQDKIAILLTSLPPEAAHRVLDRLGPERSRRLRGLMQQAKAAPPPDLLQQVWRELEEQFRLSRDRSSRATLRVVPATAGAEAEPQDALRPTHDVGGRGAADDGSAPDRRPGFTADEIHEPELMGDPIAELRQVEVERLAPALEGEHPRTVATVLSCLEADKAGEALKRLPTETRRDVFLRLGQPAGGGPDLVQRIVRAVLQKSQAVAASPVAASGHDRAKMMADMLKSMERTDRMDLLGTLEAQDGELAAAVRDRLYVFEDLLVIEDRSVQKLLGEIDSKTLALALKEAPEKIAAKVMNNLSKRARETVAEEISFLGAIPPAQIEQARKAVVEVIQRLDQAGELMMTQ